MWLLGRIIYWCLLYQITGANYLICRHFKIRHILSVLQALLYTFWARIIYILPLSWAKVPNFSKNSIWRLPLLVNMVRPSLIKFPRGQWLCMVLELYLVKKYNTSYSRVSTAHLWLGLWGGVVVVLHWSNFNRRA